MSDSSDINPRDQIGSPPQGVELSPHNCCDVWPEFVLKHGLRQLEGEHVCEFITRFCKHIDKFSEDWEHFPNPKSAQALFCLGGFRNKWIRIVVGRVCQTPENIGEIKAWLVKYIPYFESALRRRNTTARRVRKGLPIRWSRLEVFPWQYLCLKRHPYPPVLKQIAIRIWNIRPLRKGESEIYEGYTLR